MCILSIDYPVTFLGLMKIAALLNNSNLHNSPTAERFYRLRLQQATRRPNFHRPPVFTPTPEKPRAKELSRDEKIEIRALRKYTKCSESTISQLTGHSERQVQLALNGPLTPQKKVGLGLRARAYIASSSL